MKVLLKCWNFIRQHVNKYLVVFIIFLIMILFVDEHNLFRFMNYKRKTNELKIEKLKYESARDSCKKESDDILKPDNDQAERIAREKYRMKKDDEDVFVLKKPVKKDE